MSNRSSETVGPSVIHGPNDVSSASENATMITHTHVRERTSAQPSRSSVSIVVRTAGAPRARGRSRTRNAADTRKVAASIANAKPGPTPSTSSVASAGPTNSATVSTVPNAAFAGWISSSGTVCGTRPV